MSTKEEKKKARLELLRMMDNDPRWDEKPEKVAYRNKLLAIIDVSFNIKNNPDLLRNIYIEQGIQGVADTYNVSRATAYYWLDKFKIPRTRGKR